MNKFTRRAMPLLMVLFAISTAFGQTATIKGTVKDQSTGETMPGVNVLIKGTLIGTSTDFDGNYVLENIPAGEVEVEASFIGFLPTTKTVILNADETLNLDLALEVDAVVLEEYVVIGYGVQKKTDRTGAVASIKSDEMNAGVLTDPVQAIQGKIAGVSVTKKGGDPNAGFDIKIRGAASLTTSTGPLYVVDGIPGVDPTTIAAEDIESWNVLKDASSAAIYGSRGANGVVMITTKRGTSGTGTREAQIDFNSYLSTDFVSNRLSLLNADQIRSYVSENNLNFEDGGANTDWQDEIYRPGMSQNYNLSITGGDKKSSYRASLSHQDFEGVIIGTQKKRTIGRINLDQKAFDDRLTISAGLSGTFEENDYISYESNGPNDVLYQAFQRNPTDPLLGADGEYYETQRQFNYWNPVALVNQIQNDRSAKRFFGFFKADLDIYRGISAGINLGYTRDDYESFYFEPSTIRLGTTSGYGRRAYGNYESKVLETTLRYLKDFGKHNLNLVAGYSFQEDFSTGLSAQGSKPFLNYTQSNDLSLFQTVVPGDINSYKESNRLISFFGRGMYNFNSRYFVTATIRRDGSSRFGDNNKWGWFPSASVAWRISSEDFMDNLDFINNLQLRVGYGITGNQEFANYTSLAYYIRTGNSINFETGEESVAFSFSHNANPNIKWEENAELNIGLDFGLFEEKISGSLDFFQKNTYDLLGQYTVPVPPYPVDRIWANVGEFKVTGFEAFVQVYPVRNTNFDWKTSLTFSTYKQEVISLSNDEFNWSVQREGWLSGRGLVGDLNWTQIVEPGRSLGTWFMPEYAGLSSDGKFLFYTASGGVTRNLEDAERRVVGDAQPDFEIGWSNYFSFFKNWDMSFNLRAVYGYEIFNTTKLIFGNPIWLPEINVLESALDEAARGLNDNPKLSSYYLEDGSFIRLDNISLGYNFKNVGFVRNIRLYFTSNNLLTITNYSGIDPEISTSGLSYGLDQYNVYPKTRTFTFGVNVTL
ncbi:MAG: SusC/RagA family TonB-linked outer membrane protein [Bacteroidetes bacterium]|jgi:TonB-linked SusC/RagA family outer membrane protein|nr:SusC/RagA family TonB-linked outer membrane protein [Bacteroidota bacterium]